MFCTVPKQCVQLLKLEEGSVSLSPIFMRWVLAAPVTAREASSLYSP